MTTEDEERLHKIVEDFVVNTLQNRYEEYVSNKFLIALMIKMCAPKINDILGGDPNEAYHAVVPIFESILEYRCQAGGNGHHVAQNFQTHVEKHVNPMDR